VKHVVRDARLVVIGEGWEEYRKTMTDNGSIRFTGYLEDIRPHCSRSDVMVAPIRIGGGTRLKIVEAMALGIAVVTTTIGCEGIAVKDGRDVLVADEPQLFARRIAEALSNAQLRHRLTESAYKIAQQHYSWNKLSEQMEKVYSER
jgi:glycosyltransferase involved in cell wall biosynthesis